MSGLPDYAEALGLALRAVRPLDRIETVELENASGRVLAEPILADRDLPPFDRAMMDGYALRAAEFAAIPGKLWPVAHVIAAGSSPNVDVPPGSCVAIATGAALPGDVDAVIPHEQSDRGNPVRFTVNSISAGNAVHKRGSDAKKGDMLIETGSVMSGHHLGIAAAVGAVSIGARAKPQAAILTSGDEVVVPTTALEKLLPHQIRNSNGMMVAELLRRFGAEPAHSRHLPDERESTIAAVKEAIEHSDLVITIGGVSVGERDHFPAAFAANGVVPSLAGASIQPGRPIFVGRTSHKVVIGLPGNPVSVLACACLFVWPIVRVLLGLDANLSWREVELAKEVKPNPQRRAFRPAILQSDGRAVVPAWAGSGDLAHTAPTHGLLELPVQSDAVPGGTRLRFLPWP